MAQLVTLLGEVINTTNKPVHMAQRITLLNTINTPLYMEKVINVTNTPLDMAQQDNFNRGKS